MLRLLLRQVLVVAAAALLLTACATGNRPALAAQTGVTRITLTSEQSQALESGVRQMVDNPGAARLSAVSAITIAQQAGVHVCGYVKTKDAAGKEGPDLPFYVEMLEVEGKPVAERGQVGSDPSRAAKIKFMCRRNG